MREILKRQRSVQPSLHLEELKESYEPGKIFQTQMQEERREELYAGWKKAVNATRAFK